MYYDPKSKLYCKNMRWHRHVPGQDPPFVPVEQDGTANQQNKNQDAAAGAATSTSSAGGEGVNIQTQAQAGATLNGPGAGSTGTATTARVSGPSGVAKRSSGIGGKKQRIAFGFKGIKLAKSGAGSSSVGGGAGMGGGGSSDEGEGGTKGSEMSAGNLGSGPGALAKKRRLEDLSKWNARKLEVCLPGEEGGRTFVARRSMGEL